MKNECLEVIFLNPKKTFLHILKKYIYANGFEEMKDNECKNSWNYEKDEAIIEIEQFEDFEGFYVILLCEGISSNKLRETLNVCPECGSSNLQVSILFCWRNELTEQLYEEGKLVYGPGAYDRMGTRPETKRCLNCGCKWHNSADILYWNKCILEDKGLTKEALGIV